MTLEDMKMIKEERGYSLKQLAAYTGVPLGTIQKIFSGETENPRAATKNAIEKVLKSDEAIYAGKAVTYESNKVSADVIKDSSAAYSISDEGPRRATIADYYHLPDDQRMELIDGCFFEMNSPTFTHQGIISEIAFQLESQIRKKKGPCKVVLSPMDVQFDEKDDTIVQPDLMIVCDRDKIKHFGILGAPDFILEVVSKSSRKKDGTIKLNKYAQYNVQEYWLIDPKRRSLVVYSCSNDYIPAVYPLDGSVPLEIYHGEILVDLSAVNDLINEFGSEE